MAASTAGKAEPSVEEQVTWDPGAAAGLPWSQLPAHCHPGLRQAAGLGTTTQPGSPSKESGRTPLGADSSLECGGGGEQHRCLYRWAPLKLLRHSPSGSDYPPTPLSPNPLVNHRILRNERPSVHPGLCGFGAGFDGNDVWKIFFFFFEDYLYERLCDEDLKI